jgi:hypothetical protein
MNPVAPEVAPEVAPPETPEPNTSGNSSDIVLQLIQYTYPVKDQSPIAKFAVVSGQFSNRDIKQVSLNFDKNACKYDYKSPNILPEALCIDVGNHISLTPLPSGDSIRVTVKEKNCAGLDEFFLTKSASVKNAPVMIRQKDHMNAVASFNNLHNLQSEIDKATTANNDYLKKMLTDRKTKFDSCRITVNEEKVSRIGEEGGASRKSRRARKSGRKSKKASKKAKKSGKKSRRNSRR